jgi:lipopolysaccharide transport system ATP-binding protein
VPATAIRISGLGKQYRTGQGMPHQRLTEAITDLAMSPLNALRSRPRDQDRSAGRAETFWALKDISMEIGEGEIVGIIGRNGAGKSTLLKILSRITEPTIGDVWLHGRVGSLLEVGTGFHPDLSGRENIFLNGAILGMSREEIRARFDEIVAFSEIEKFLDTPVKRYSSGMYMRLAFSVAAHLEPEILLVDEVLAVGDAQFQAKCLGKLSEVVEGGRTVLFVSHNLPAIERLCTSAIVLREGRIDFAGTPGKAIAAYLQSGRQSSYAWQRSVPPPQPQPHFERAVLCQADGARCLSPTTGTQLGVRIYFSMPAPKRDLVIAVGVFNDMGHPIFSSSPLDVDLKLPEEPGEYSTTLLFPPALFLPKRYAICLSMYDAHQSLDLQMDALSFEVTETANFGNRVPTGRIGDIQLDCSWSACAREAAHLDE